MKINITKSNSLQYPSTSSSSSSSSSSNNGRSNRRGSAYGIYCCCCSDKMITLLLLTIVLICYTTYTHQSYQQLRYQQGNGGEINFSPLNDKTFRWSPSTKRHLWLEYEEQEQRNQEHFHGITIPEASSEQQLQQTLPQQLSNIEKPTFMLLLTNYGWNQKNLFRNKFVPRCIRTSELIQGVIDHPNFHPTAYEEIMNQKRIVDPNIRYYIFMDIDTCFETNYPNYGSNFQGNSDVNGFRFRGRKRLMQCYDLLHCTTIGKVLSNSYFFQPENNKSIRNNNENNQMATTTTTTTTEYNPFNRLVTFECRGNGPSRLFRHRAHNTTNLALVSLSSHAYQFIESHNNPLSGDQGLPPPIPGNKLDTLQLSNKQIHDIESCAADGIVITNDGNNITIESIPPTRDYFLTFSGNLRRNQLREELAKLHNPNENIMIVETNELLSQTNGTSFEQLLQRSIFAATPRGTNSFSYRFTEALSAGAIPVLMADEWILPFIQPTIVNWEECIVKIPENQIDSNMMNILKAITPEQRCRMRQACYRIYSTYMSNADQTIHGIINGLESIAITNTIH